MMRVIERREWLEGVPGDGEWARREVVFEHPLSSHRYTLACSEAIFAAHPLGLEVALSARAPDGEC